jgi:hypothetical protein
VSTASKTTTRSAFFVGSTGKAALDWTAAREEPNGERFAVVAEDHQAPIDFGAAGFAGDLAPAFRPG